MLTFSEPVVYKEKKPSFFKDSFFLKDGDYLLSHLRSTIGVVGLNFSVRNGKRWDPNAIVTLNMVDMVYAFKYVVSGMPPFDAHASGMAPDVMSGMTCFFWKEVTGN